METDFIFPPLDWIEASEQVPLSVLEGLSPELREAISVVRAERVAGLWKAVDAVKWGGRAGAVFKQQYNVFAQGGYYPEVDRLLGYANEHPGETEAWLREKTESAGSGEKKLLLIGSRPEAFLVSPEMFASYWSQICGRASEVVFVVPPGRKWLLVWHCTGSFFSFCRRNPDAQTFLLDLPREEAERLVSGVFEDALDLPITNPTSYPDGEQTRRVRIDYPNARLPTPEAALDDCSYYHLSREALDQALQVCLLEPHDMALEAFRRLDERIPEPDFPFGWKEGTRTWRKAIAEGTETNPIWVEAYRWATPVK